jgi:hypothetical protein
VINSRKGFEFWVLSWMNQPPKDAGKKNKDKSNKVKNPKLILFQSLKTQHPTLSSVIGYGKEDR